MNIAFDIQSVQLTKNANRGIARYTISLIKTIISIGEYDHIFLIGNANLPNVNYIFEHEIKSLSEKISYLDIHYLDTESQSLLSSNQYKELSIQIRSSFFSQLDVDLIVITSFFEGYYDGAIIPFDKKYPLPPIVSIIYDLIPLLLPEQYLCDLNYKEFYLTRLIYLNELDYAFTISESSSNEVLDNTSLIKKDIFNIGAGCDFKFSNLASLAKDKSNRFSNLKYFILYTGAGDPRKNLDNLIQAYSKLSLSLRKKFKLIIAGNLLKDEIDKLTFTIHLYKLDLDCVRLVGYVSDEELLTLYRKCSLFIFPSLHEGFGLPVLEAMSCGAPVIGSNTTSIPEIIQNEQALFDPNNVFDISNIMTKALLDNSFRKLLVENSEIQKKRYSWKSTANTFLFHAKNIIEEYRSSSIVGCDFHYLHHPYPNNYFLAQLDDIIESYQISNQDELLSLISVSLSINFSSALSRSRFNYLKKSDNQWFIEGPYDSSYSLSILNSNFALALKNKGEQVILSSSEGTGDYQPNLDYLTTNEELLNLHNESLNLKNNFTINSRNMYPPRVRDMNSAINLLHAYGWEETQLPSEWVMDFNSFLQGITVMSNQVKKILIDNGVSVKISICGLGIDHLTDISPEDNFLIPTKSFSFLHISSCFPRKGIDVLLEAYGKAFSKDDDVSLVIKTFPNPHNNVDSILYEFESTNPNYPHVVLINEDFSSNKIVSLYSQSDALVAPSFGEGFGLPIAEAIAHGLPVITTGWGGQLDFCNSANSLLIDFEFEFAKSHFDLFSSVWAKPSADHLASLMKKMLLNSASLPLEGINSRLNIIDKYKWTDVAQNNIEFISKIRQNSTIPKINVGWVSTWNSKCGIAGYSKRLVNNFFNDVTIYAPFKEDLIEEDSLNIHRCWEFLSSNLDNLYNNLVKNNTSIVVIQFNFGFFDYPPFKTFLDKLRIHNIKSIILMHSTAHPLTQEYKKLSNLLPELNCVNRILVHTPNDLNSLKKIGLLDNVSLFPHGVLQTQYKQDYKFQKPFNFDQNVYISTFGFCLPNKGFEELIIATVNLRKENININLSLHTSIYNEDYSSYYIHLCKLIKQYSAEEYISIDPRYKDDKQVLEDLASSDLILFPYQQSQESSSAAVRQALSSGVPILVTPLAIFDDVSKVVNYLDGFSVNSISEGIKNYFFLNDHSFRKSLMKKYKLSVKWREQHSFEKVSARLEGMIKSLHIN